MSSWKVYVVILVALVTGVAFLYIAPANRQYEEIIEQQFRFESDLKGIRKRQIQIGHELERLTELVAGIPEEISTLHSEVAQWRKLKPMQALPDLQTKPAYPGPAYQPIEQIPTMSHTSEATVSETVVDQELINRERLERQDGLFESEEYDPEWAQVTHQRIIEIFDKINESDSRLKGVECRETRCRVNVLHDNEAAEREFLYSFPMYLGQIFPRAVMNHIKLDDGIVETVIHLSK